MGIPKFYRWISERYPLISQLIEGDKIPEFDNLYLDMNGILHNCTHKDSDDATFRMTEDQMFIAIFRYIDLLFEKVKPKKLFFMAIDGVAPRAKMNQQRSRRFRTALDAENARQKAISQGTELPAEAPFDTNSITPGTEFMVKLSTQLHYFVSRKVSEDSRWQNIQIVLSGHEVPGEGEHKIMEYIRAAKSQPGYNANTRHCLYGLDADLIMLGLVSHDPHFSLLREEVTFGPARNKPKDLFRQKFFLLHLSLVREYLELEFKDLKHTLTFPFDMEHVIDDFILLCVFVGNDFLPNLPQLHINEGALTFMFEAYKKILPLCKGYLNDSGTINLETLRMLLKELVTFEFKLFEADHDDKLYSESKSTSDGRKPRNKKQAPLTITTRESAIFESIETYVNVAQESEESKWEIPRKLVGQELDFIKTLATKLSLELTIDDENVKLTMPSVENSDESDEESEFAVQRVLEQYRSAKVQEADKKGEEKAHDAVMERFIAWKDDYYKEKFGFSYHNQEAMTELCSNYVQGLQWVMNYYYKGVCSWAWFFKYHYAPRVSDISKGLEADLNFQLGQPFKPFQQLMGVMPPLSDSLIPMAYRPLLHDPKSPIIDFYPLEFELDLNGKKMDWEAVVKIPFVDEGRLLKAMAAHDRELTPGERKRNTFGKMIQFKYDNSVDSIYESSLRDVFPDIDHNHCSITEYEFPPMEGKVYKSCLSPGALLGGDMLAGFPSLKTIPFTAELTTSHSVCVFERDSRSEAMVISIENRFENTTVEDIAEKLLHQSVYVGYPYLREAQVISVSDELFNYAKLTVQGRQEVRPTSNHQEEIQRYFKKTGEAYKNYARHGVDIGETAVAITVRLLKGLRQLPSGALVKEFDTDLEKEAVIPVQTLLTSVVNEDQRFVERAAPKVDEQYPVGTRGFYLGPEAYGRPLQVVKISDASHVDVALNIAKYANDTGFGVAIAREEQAKMVYFTSIEVCRELGLPMLLLSKITASFSATFDGSKNTNLGLNLKFESKKLKVLGYTRRTATGWEYSLQAKELVKEYMTKFPRLFQGLVKELHTDRPDIAVLLGSEHAAKEQLPAIKAWLKSKESVRMERVPLDSEQLLPEAVQKIESTVDKILQKDASTEIKMLKHVVPAVLFKPADAIHKLQNQKFQLGDRVLYAKDTGNVPIASTGTVIGISTIDGRKVLDVVFDYTFLGGITLSGRCSEDRGMTVEGSSVINLTNRQVGNSGSHRSSPQPQQHQQQHGAQRGRGGVNAGGRGRGGPSNGRGGAQTGRGGYPSGHAGVLHVARGGGQPARGRGGRPRQAV